MRGTWRRGIPPLPPDEERAISDEPTLDADDAEVEDYQELETELDEDDGDEFAEAPSDFDDFDDEDDEDDDDPIALVTFEDEEVVADEEAADVDEGADDPSTDGDGLRAGEFVCRSCYMAKRESALADPQRMLCRDCA